MTGQTIYAYTGGNPISRSDPMGLTTVVVVNLNGPTWDNHVGLFVGNTSTPGLRNNMVYDPGGSYVYNGHPSGENYVYEGQDANYADYVAFERRDGPNVKTYRFDTTKEEEAQIIQNATNYDGAAPLYCAKSVRNVLNGVGRFGKLGTGWLTPSSLADLISKIPRK